MPNYVVLVNWTDQGIRNVKDSPKRAEAYMKLVEQSGGKSQLFFTMGDYDIVSIVQAPTDEAMLKILLATSSLGNVRTKTLKAWTPEEASRVFAQLP